jgi:hypothetical protein
VEDTKWNEQTKIGKFIEGLHPSIINKIYSADTFPTLLTEAQEKAMQYGQRQEAQQMIKRHFSFQPRGPPASAPLGSRENPIEVNTLSMEERRRLDEEGKCYLCKQQGHFAIECPNRNRNQSNYRGRGYNRGGFKGRGG